MRKSTFAGVTILDEGESLIADDGAFLGRDRETIDFFLERGAKTHRHTGLAGITNPTVAPSGSVVASGGSIPSDLDLVFGYTLQDGERGETALSPTATVSTPPPLTRPENAIGAEPDYTDGILTVDSYYYAITYVDDDGGETPLGPPTIAQRQPGYANARVLLTGLDDGLAGAGAAGWRLYRARSGGQFAYLASGATDSYTDDGTVSPVCDAQPPNDDFNTTNQINSIIIDLPDSGAFDPGAEFINVYLSDSGAFTGNVFLEQFPVASAGASVTYTSLTLLPDQPPVVSTAVGNPPQIDAATEIDWGDAGMPSGAAQVIQDEGVDLPDEGRLNFVGDGVTVSDDPGNGATIVTIPGASGGASGVGSGGTISISDAAMNVAEDIDWITFTGFNGTEAIVDDNFDGSANVYIGLARVRDTISDTTASLASGASGSADLSAARGQMAVNVETSREARVQVYATAADRTADAARPIGTDPVGDHGVLLDVVTVSGDLSWRLSPAVLLANMDTPAVGTLYLRITNMGSVGTVTTTLTRIVVEE